MTKPLSEETIEAVREPACDLLNKRKIELGQNVYEKRDGIHQRVYSCVDLLISNLRAGKIKDWSEVPPFLASRMKAHDEKQSDYLSSDNKMIKADEGKLAVLCVAELLEVKAQTELAYEQLQPPKRSPRKR